MDLFAPPTEDEISAGPDLFAPPSKGELGEESLLSKVAPYLTSKTLIEKIDPSLGEERPLYGDDARKSLGDDFMKMNGIPETYKPSEAIAGPIDLAASAIGSAAIKPIMQGAGRIGSGVKNLIDDVATAPLMKPGIENAGRFARGVSKVGQVGNAVDDKIDDIVSPLVRTGNSTADALSRTAIKKSAYAVPGAQLAAGAIDAAKLTPSVAQFAAKGLANGLESMIPRMGKFTPVLASAVERGGSALAATNFVLQQSNPEYREMLKQAGAMGEENE